MKLVHIFIFALAIAACPIKAQQLEPFDLQLPTAHTVNNSLYSNVEFLDNRSDAEYNHLPIDHATFNNKLNYFVDQSAKTTAQNGILFVQLRSLDTFFDKKKKCYTTSLRINLFERINNNYYFINGLDTTLETPEKQSPVASISDLIYDYIAKNLSATYTDNQPYTLDDIHNFDLIEKVEMPLYTNAKLVDGIYLNFEDFAKQYPLDDKMEVKMKKGEIKEIKAMNMRSKKSIKVKPESIYAIVVDGQPYISFDKKYLPLYKDNDDLWFEDESIEGNLSVIPSGGISFGSGGYRGGGIGLNFQKNNRKIKIVYKVDHLTGKATQVASR